MRNVTGTDASLRGVWLRDMENAQIDAWLNHPTPSQASKMEMTMRQDNGEQPPCLKLVPPTVAAENSTKIPAKAFLYDKPSVSPVLQPQDRLAYIRPTQPPISWPVEAEIMPTRMSPVGDCSSKLSTPSLLQSKFPSDFAAYLVAETETRTPIRVHMQESPDGLQLWLGLDINEQANVRTLAARIMTTLESQGIRLARLVCNGRAIYEDPRIGGLHDKQPLCPPPFYNQES
jgi:hypothetical protein